MKKILAGLVVLLQMQVFAGGEPVKAAAVTSSDFESKAHGGFGDFLPGNTVDGNLAAASSWRAEIKDPDKGQWIQYDLGAEKKLDSVQIAFLSGSKRIYRFKIEGSTDGEKWTEIFSGTSSGQPEFETFDAGGASARYVRLTGYGNTGIGVESPFPKWFNIVETKISVRE
jgi:hypothetical protein